MSAPSRAPARQLDRDAVLATVMDPRRLPTPRAVALQVVNAASRPDCSPAEIVSLLAQDPALCAKLLKAVNSCLYGRSKPIASLERAVTVLGLGTVRSLVLGVSMPALKGGPTDPAARGYQITSLAGALIAYDLSAQQPKSAPADDMVAGLLRDIGAVLLQQTFPDAWQEMTERWGDRLLAEACEAELETFGVSHAEISAELLSTWKLPPEIVEPIRYHHDPAQLTGSPPVLIRRAELLYYAGLLANLDTVVRHPTVLEYTLDVARERYGMSQPMLVRFLKGIMPKITEFGELLDRDVSGCQDLSAVLEADLELHELAGAAGRSKARPLSGERNRGPQSVASRSLAQQVFGPPARAPKNGSKDDVWASARCTPFSGAAAPTRANERPAPVPALPEFRPGFLEEFPAGGCLLGEYELRAVLGRGAMGVVFKGYEPSLDRPVAVKMIVPEAAASEKARERFAREARSGAAIRHDNVVTIYAVREVNGVPYLAMEYVEGVALDRHIERNSPLPLAEVVRIGAQVAAGLAAAHKKGIVHRDIKPANVILESETGTAKLADFGLARQDDGDASQSGAMVGTPHFMSPEQVHGQPVGAASDVFSLGGVLYALCTGRPPFTGGHTMAILYAVCSTDPKRPRELRPDVPEWLDELVMRALDKNPARRGSAAEHANTLASKTV